MKKRLSVIIPMYNAKAYIKRCIDSILNQGFEGLEIIAVDDGSTDATCSVIQGYADERIRLVRQEKKGVSAARNAGLDLAQGTYVVFADADDYLLDGSLKAMYGTITAQDAELAVFGYINEKTGCRMKKSMPDYRSWRGIWPSSTCSGPRHSAAFYGTRFLSGT